MAWSSGGMCRASRGAVEEREGAGECGHDHRTVPDVFPALGATQMQGSRAEGPSGPRAGDTHRKDAEPGRAGFGGQRYPQQARAADAGGNDYPPAPGAGRRRIGVGGGQAPGSSGRGPPCATRYIPATGPGGRCASPGCARRAPSARRRRRGWGRRGRGRGSNGRATTSFVIESMSARPVAVSTSVTRVSHSEDSPG